VPWPAVSRAAPSWSTKPRAEDSFTANHVFEVGGPRPCVVVAAVTGTAVVLPLPFSPQIPTPAELCAVRAREYRWPPTASHALTNEVERVYRAGGLFHADLCHTHK
jgi:hypothetical protein